MRVPVNWYLSGLDHHGVVWFRREFQLRPRLQHISLHFDGVDYFADVFLNGELLGHHTGYFDPFEFEITKTFRSGKNLLAVRVESPYESIGPDGWFMHKRLIKGVLNHHDCRPGGGWEPTGQSYNTGGIWNRVYIEQHGTMTISQLLLRADMDSEPPSLHVDLWVRNRSKKVSTKLEIHCDPENFRGKKQTSSFTMELPEGESVQSLQMPVADIHTVATLGSGFSTSL